MNLVIYILVFFTFAIGMVVGDFGLNTVDFNFLYPRMKAFLDMFTHVTASDFNLHTNNDTIALDLSPLLKISYTPLKEDRMDSAGTFFVSFGQPQSYKYMNDFTDMMANNYTNLASDGINLSDYGYYELATSWTRSLTKNKHSRKGTKTTSFVHKLVLADDCIDLIRNISLDFGLLRSVIPSKRDRGRYQLTINAKSTLNIKNRKDLLKINGDAFLEALDNKQFKQTNATRRFRYSKVNYKLHFYSGWSYWVSFNKRNLRKLGIQEKGAYLIKKIFKNEKDKPKKTIGFHKETLSTQFVKCNTGDKFPNFLFGEGCRTISILKSSKGASKKHQSSNDKIFLGTMAAPSKNEVFKIILKVGSKAKNSKIIGTCLVESNQTNETISVYYGSDKIVILPSFDRFIEYIQSDKFMRKYERYFIFSLYEMYFAPTILWFDKCVEDFVNDLDLNEILTDLSISFPSNGIINTRLEKNGTVTHTYEVKPYGFIQNFTMQVDNFEQMLESISDEYTNVMVYFRVTANSIMQVLELMVEFEEVKPLFVFRRFLGDEARRKIVAFFRNGYHSSYLSW